jgi:hypothetical protein
MKVLRNIAVGFGISFIGSVPLGYLNVIGYHIYSDLGMKGLVSYLFGVMCVEAAVIYLTLIFANRLSQNQRLMKAVDLLSVFFMLAIAYLFCTQADGDLHSATELPGRTLFVSGVLLSAVNIMQFPFWVGWNLYLLGGRYISAKAPYRYMYLAGTLGGTFAGMLIFVVFIATLAQRSDLLSRYLMGVIVPLFFVGMAVLQAWKFYKKHCAAQKDGSR